MGWSGAPQATGALTQAGAPPGSVQQAHQGPGGADQESQFEQRVTEAIWNTIRDGDSGRQNDCERP